MCVCVCVCVCVCASGTTLHSALGCGVPQEYGDFGRMDARRVQEYEVLILVRVCGHLCACVCVRERKLNGNSECVCVCVPTAALDH